MNKEVDVFEMLSNKVLQGKGFIYFFFNRTWLVTADECYYMLCCILTGIH